MSQDRSWGNDDEFWSSATLYSGGHCGTTRLPLSGAPGYCRVSIARDRCRSCASDNRQYAVVQRALERHRGRGRAAAFTALPDLTIFCVGLPSTLVFHPRLFHFVLWQMMTLLQPPKIIHLSHRSGHVAKTGEEHFLSSWQSAHDTISWRLWAHKYL
ncbi:hypothetical protein EJ04DRAFT_344212 [Polyplosphaeria fusca]|uniref:Uncharacterized protein n=1 Tax=Polyplosphaeria fusca TaxID=682080 RepID=A0A9P4V1A6_9PLEO|nr:hypothetical protein EJ04DRAFT_344212 [Polyplosphaeria fusca]